MWDSGKRVELEYVNLGGSSIDMLFKAVKCTYDSQGGKSEKKKKKERGQNGAP